MLTIQKFREIELIVTQKNNKVAQHELKWSHFNMSELNV